MAKKQYFPLLPKLVDNASVNPDKASVWEDEPYDFLESLIKSLAVSDAVKDVGYIDSIPDVWARPLLFQMALFDETDTSSGGLHKWVLGEWRSLLAMIALKDVRHLNLRAEAVHIDNEDAGLAQVLKALAPQNNTISRQDTDWTNIYVLFFNDIPIGITSPTTLVSAAADYMTAFNGTIPQPWSRNGLTLDDPIAVLMPEDLEELYCWLDKIYQSLRDIKGEEDNLLYQSILRCLDEYKADIKRKNPHVGRAFELIDADLSLNIGVFRCLNRTIKGRPASAEDSAVRLLVSAARQPKNDVLIVSPEMVRAFAAQEGVQATQLVVWPGISANDVNDSSLKKGERNRIGIASLGKTEYYRPEDFFTERMTVMEPGRIVKASLDIEGMEVLANEDLTPIPPINRLLLEFFSPEEIAQRLSIENKSDRIIVKFRFPLSGINGQASEYRYSKEYAKEDLIYLDTNVPVVEIWPNFRREGWNKYYLYYENSEALNEGTDTLGRNFFYVDPWSYGKEITKDVPEHGLANRYTARMDGFPEALVCTVIPSQDGAYAQPVETGSFLLKQPPMVSREPELTWQLGVDFGTSSTMLFYREGNYDPKPLAFQPHMYQVTESGYARNNTYISFIPSEQQENADGSFLSIFHLLNPSKLHEDIRPLQDGHVFQLTTERTDVFKQRAQRIDSNLKWKNDDIGRRKVAAYIKQICLQSITEAAARGVDKIHWNFSFPTAFSKEQQFAFQQTCEEAVDEAYAETCFTKTDETIEPWPESKASAYHFNKLGNSDTNFGDGAICLDIGAGTTDISIISGQPGKIVYHTSIQFAGRYLFRPIYSHYDLFARENPDLTGADKEKQSAIIDADMREHSEEYLRNLKNITGREEVKNVLQDSQLATAGIFFYLGDILKELSAKGIYTEKHVPDIFVGGNGSRIFSWLTGGTFAPNSPYLQVLKDMIIEASGLDEDSRFDIHLSDKPKVEVAAGMIEERPHNDAEFFNEAEQTKELFGGKVDDYIASSVLSGENYLADGKEESPESFISAYDISKGINVQNLDELKNFITSFNKNTHIWSDGVELTEDEAHDILKRVNSYYISEKDKDVKKIYVEPVFIVGLKKTMEMLIKD